MKISRLQHIHRALARRRTLIAILIIAVSSIVRALYYHDLTSGPLIQQHLWTQTDMSYFDRWARAIAAGNWLSRDVDPPMHRWMLGPAEDYYAKHPEANPQANPNETEAAAIERRDLAIWKKWIGENRFFQEPLYPYLIALTYRFIGDDVRCVFVWQMALGVGLNLLIYLVARQAFGDLTGVIAATIAILYSPLLLYDLILLRDSSVAFMTMLLTWIFFRSLKRNNTLQWAAFGCCCGVAMMLKSHFIIAMLVAVTWIVMRVRRKPRELIRQLAVLAAGLLLGLSPLMGRNLALGVAPFAGAGNAAGTIIVTNAEDAGATDWGMNHYAELMVVGDGKVLPTFIATLRTHPGLSHYLALVWSKFDAAWRWLEQPSNENFYYYRLHSPTLKFLPATYYVVAPFGLVGLILAGARYRHAWPAYLPVLINLPVLLIFFVQARYRVSLAAGMIPFAALTVAYIVRGVVGRNGWPTALTILSVFIVMLWTGRGLPSGELTIRSADFAAPFQYYYGPRIIEAQKRGDMPQAVKAFEEGLSIQPEVVRSFVPGRSARSWQESQMMGLYSQIYASYSKLLIAAGRQADSAAAQARSSDLARAAQPPG